jgi:UDP-N-acetylglucosamine--N-acetylmuramyl-(pentapeptide) pyrophosphoryl-undecaprenol N-acetylglucosamine transferase
MRLLIAAGGTGGHVYPALAVATSLRRRPGRPELAWVGGRRGLEDRLVPPAGIPLRLLLLRSLRSVERDIHLVLDPIRLGLSVPQALWALARRRPAAVFTTGGYVAIPVLIAARLLGIPTLLWEGNVVPGRSVRATARFASAIAVSFAETCRALPAGRPCYVTGTPIRDVLAIDRMAARERQGVGPNERFVVIFGGSQATRTLNDAVAGAMPELARRAIVLHVTGEDDETAERRRRDLPPELAGRYRPVAFLGDDLLDALAAADLVVGRAGSSTLAEVTAFGLPMVVVPYPHAGAHQRRNAVELAEAGAARLVENDAFDGPALLAALDIVEAPERHVAMSAAARAMARPGSADAVAELLLSLADRRPLPDPATVARIAAGPMRATT